MVPDLQSGAALQLRGYSHEIVVGKCIRYIYVALPLSYLPLFGREGFEPSSTAPKMLCKRYTRLTTKIDNALH